MIVLVRHGRTNGGKGYCVGRTAVPLADEGIDQAVEIAEALRGVEFARLCSSPSQRAVDTIAPLAESLGKQVDILPALDEIDMGIWDGVAFDVIRQKFSSEYAERGKRFGDFRPPGGESFSDVADRSLVALLKLSKENQPIIIATHAGVIRSVLCRITGHPLDDLFHFDPGYARCTVLAPVDGGLQLVAMDIDLDEVASRLSSSGNVNPDI